MSIATTAGPYTAYLDMESKWWRIKGPTQCGSGYARKDHAQEEASALNDAFTAGQASREQAHPQTEDLEAHREELIEMAARFFSEDGVYHPADNYYIVKRGPVAGDCARIIAGYLMDITPAATNSRIK